MVCSDVLNLLFWRRLNLDDGLRQRLSELPGTKNLANLALRANALSDVRVGAAALLHDLACLECMHSYILPACVRPMQVTMNCLLPGRGAAGMLLVHR